MSNILKNTEKAYSILKDYNGSNPYIITLKNNVYVYKTCTLNDFQIEFILSNHDFKPVLINKLVKMADWWAEKRKEEWGIDFLPKALVIGWYIGSAKDLYVFYAKYRRSEDGKLMFVPKSAVLTDFLSDDYNKLEVDFTPYNQKSGRTLRVYQEEGVKFLLARKKAILASEMGSGKSMTAIVAALEDKYEHILIISPASVKKTWEKELGLLVDSDDITIVEGSTWRDAKFTIINYDILDNFYEIPTETVIKKEIGVDDDGNIVYNKKEKDVVSRKSKVINTAMENSQLFQANFDLVIIDEAHRLSNTSSGRYKIVTDLLKRSNPKGIYALTGTPITNRPINFFNILKIIGSPLANDWQYYVMRYCDGKSMYKKNERDAFTRIFLNKVHKKSWYDLSYSEKDELNEYLERTCKKIWITNGASNLDELQERIKPYYLRRLKSDFGNVVKKTVKVLKYKLTKREKRGYDAVWDEYKNAIESENSNGDVDKYRKITEGTLLRQWLANSMVDKTISLAEKCIKTGRKIVIFCAFDEELNTLKEHFKEICVVHNGKMTAKKKNESVEKFQNDPNIKVFIGNINSAGVGLTLVAGSVAIFNSFSWVSGDNLQAEDRIHRLNQTKDVTVYYQIFKDTFYEEMFDKVRGKQEIIDNIIVSENEK